MAWCLINDHDDTGWSTHANNNSKSHDISWQNIVMVLNHDCKSLCGCSHRSILNRWWLMISGGKLDNTADGMLGLFNIGYLFEAHLNPNLVKSRLPITYYSVTQSFWNFAQSTAVILLCSVQNLKMIGQQKRMLWTTEISRDLNLR